MHTDKKKLKRQKRERKIEQKRQQREKSLKKQWLDWSSCYDDQQVAMVEGLALCEQLARDLACFVLSQTDNFYMFSEPEQHQGLGRLVQFNELKNLWLKRNRDNILVVKKLPFNKNKNAIRSGYGFSEYYEDTFFSYFDRVQLYLHEVEIAGKQYSFFADKPGSDCVIEKQNFVYAKKMPDLVKQNLKYDFEHLVPTTEYGCRNFWREYWSKEKNRLLLSK